MFHISPNPCYILVQLLWKKQQEGIKKQGGFRPPFIAYSYLITLTGQLSAASFISLS